MNLFKRKPKLEVGQIWVYRSKNPFREDSYMLIREIKQGYVRYIDPKYKDNRDPDYYSVSESIDMFLAVSELVEEENFGPVPWN